MLKNGTLYYDDKEGKEVAIGKSVYFSKLGKVYYFQNKKLSKDPFLKILKKYRIKKINLYFIPLLYYSNIRMSNI